MDINIQSIQAELQELAGESKVKVSLSKSLPVASSIREYDIKRKHGFDIKLNPNKFRNPAKLETHLNMCREAVAG